MSVSIPIATWYVNDETTDVSGFKSIHFVLEGTEGGVNPLVGRMLSGVQLPGGFVVSSLDVGGAQNLPPLGTRLELAIRDATTTPPAGEP